MIEVGDMIHYTHWNEDNTTDDDIGWVVCIEKHLREDELTSLIYINWLSEEGGTDTIWEHNLNGYDQFTFVKGGQHER